MCAILDKMGCCGMRCIKNLLMIVNGLILIFGIVIITIACVDMGMIINNTSKEVTGYETDAGQIAIGVLIIVVAALGCFGASKERPKLLYILVGCHVFIVLVELFVGIAAVALRPQIEFTMKSQLRASFIEAKSASEEDSTYKDFWDRVQSRFQCCGVTGPDNYSSFEPGVNPFFSCCPNNGTDHVDEIKRSDCVQQRTFYKDGCQDKVLSAIHNAGLTVFACSILFCLLQVAAIILTLRLARSIKTQRKSRETV